LQKKITIDFEKTYNLNKLVFNFVPPDIFFTGSICATSWTPAESNIINDDKPKSYTILFQNFNFNDNVNETYTVNASERFTNNTVGRCKMDFFL
jgi:hypothetical protein